MVLYLQNYCISYVVFISAWSMDKLRSSTFEDNLVQFVKDWDREKCWDWTSAALIRQYSMEVCNIAMPIFENWFYAWISYPNGPFNHLRMKIINDQQDPMHAPEPWDIIIRRDGSMWLLMDAEPWETYVTILEQNEVCKITQKSYNELLWWFRTHPRQVELSERIVE